MNLPANFLNDIQGKDTSLIPLVIIEHPSFLNPDDLYISTNNISVDTWSAENATTSTNKHFQPLLLNIPSIKQSVDIENRRFKISSVTLSISNYEYEGARFSDLLQTSSMVNRTVSIFWKSPQSKIAIPSKFESFYTPFNTFDIDLDTLCPKVYTGQIRRISHTTDVVTIELEDLTEKNHKDLPQTLLPSDESVLDKYKNKPIPMVYGHVDKSPLVFSDLYRTLNADYMPIDSFQSSTNIFNETDYSLWVDVGHLINVVKTDQYQEDGNQITVTSIVPEKGIEQEVYLKCRDYSRNFQVALSNDREDSSLTTEDYDNPDGSVNAIFDGSQDSNYIDWTGSRTHNLVGTDITSYQHKDDIILLYDSNDGYLNIDFRAIYRTQQANGDQYQPEFLLLTLGFYFTPSYDFVELNSEGDSVHLIGMILNEAIFSEILPHNYQDNPQYGYVIHTNSTDNDVNPQTGFDYIGQLSNDYEGYHSLGDLENYGPGSTNYDKYALINHQINFVDTAWDSAGSEHWDGAGNNPQTSDLPGAAIHFKSSFTSSGSSATVTLNLTTPNLSGAGGLDEISLLREVRASNIFDKDYYASVNGRILNGTLAQNPATIIRHILESELGYTDFDEEDYSEAVDAHENMGFGFTVHDKQISSKKLIEDIAKSTLMFPHFGNDGKFRFNSLKESYTEVDIYGSEDVDGALVIPEPEIIDYSFSKTKPEQLYSKYEVDYYYDYAQKSYLKKVEDEFSVTDDLHLDFYGLENSDDNIGKLESAYIRDEGTAKKLNGILFNYYRNQHLILKLKLPVKYIGLAVGDLIRFEELLGGITAYGVDYTSESDLNGQLVYPLFYITSLQKNIDSVSVELIQLHNIVYGLLGDNLIYEDTDLLDRIFTPTQTEQQFKFTFADQEQFIVGNVDNQENLEALFGFQNWYIEYENGSYSEISSWGDLLPSSQLNTTAQQYGILQIWILNESEDAPLMGVYRNSESDGGGYSFVAVDIDNNPIDITLTNDSVIKLVIPEIDEGIKFRYNPPIDIVAGIQEAVYVEPEENGNDEPPTGDLNNDGDVNILDIVGLVSAVLGQSSISDDDFYNVDLNGDGTLDVLDIVIMVNMIL